MRRFLQPLLALSLGLTACHKDASPPSTEEPASTEPGDWDVTGAFARCGAVSGCGGPEALPLDASCDAATLGGFGPDGVSTLQVRSAAPGSTAFSVWPSAMRIGTGGLESLADLPVVSRQVDASHLFLAAETQGSDGRTVRRALQGCRVTAPGHLVGCYAECRDGNLTDQGSFQAVRVAPTPGEPEASGLTLVSETAVSQGVPVDVFVTQGHAYVVSLHGGLFVFNVSDAAHPRLTQHLYSESDSYWNAVWATGETLYVASASRGVRVYDIHNPDLPVLVRSVPASATNVHTLFVRGDRLYAASSDPDGVVLVFDISDAQAPALLSKFLAQGFDVRSSYGPHDMFAFEDRLYANYWGAGYVVADVSDASHPRELGRYRYAHSTSHASAVGRFGERLLAFEGGEDWGAHLRVLDVTHPEDVKRVGEWRLHENVSIHNLVLVGTRLYVAHYQDGVRVLDVSVPEQPREVAHYGTFRPWDERGASSFYDGAIGIRVPGDGYVYAVDTARGLLILKED